MARPTSPQFHILSTAQIAARRKPFLSDDLIFNHTTKELRMGPGPWSECMVLIPAPGSGAQGTITINGQSYRIYGFVRTSGVDGLITLDLTTLIPGVTDVIWGNVVIGSDIGVLAFGAVTNASDLSEYQIVVTDTTLNGTAGIEVLITLYAR